MPRTITYVECDCRQGRLEELASTEVQEETDFLSGNYGFAYDTAFYSCDRCNSLFKENRKYALGYDETGSVKKVVLLQNNVPDSASQIAPYRGKLTKSEIAFYASKVQGILSLQDEGKIIFERRGDEK